MGHAYLNSPQIVVMQRCRKIPFDTQEKALRQLRKMAGAVKSREIESTPGRLNVYQCQHCPPNTWHIGHNQRVDQSIKKERQRR